MCLDVFHSDRPLTVKPPHRHLPSPSNICVVALRTLSSAEHCYAVVTTTIRLPIQRAFELQSNRSQIVVVSAAVPAAEKIRRRQQTGFSRPPRHLIENFTTSDNGLNYAMSALCGSEQNN